MIPFVQKYSKHDITNEIWCHRVLFIFITEYCRSDISLGPLVLSSSNGLHLKCLTGALFLRAHPFDRLRHPSVSPKVPRNLRSVNTLLEECYMKEYVGSPQYKLILLEERQNTSEEAWESTKTAASTQFLEAFASDRLRRRLDAHLCSWPLLCSAVFFWSISSLPFSCKMSIGKNILQDNAVGKHLL